MDTSLSCDMDAACSAQHSALAALRLLRSYNHFQLPPDIHTVLSPLLGGVPPAPCISALGYCQHRPPLPPALPPALPPMLSPSTCDEVRRRGEKRPIPTEMKDDKYFERRRRNNQAAKKSRDARRIREDQIAWRACLLEQENSSLRAHIAALRQETIALRSLLATRDDVPAPTSTTD